LHVLELVIKSLGDKYGGKSHSNIQSFIFENTLFFRENLQMGGDAPGSRATIIGQQEWNQSDE
jgi:hypothetical protein